MTTNRRNFLKLGFGALTLPILARAAKAGGHATLTVEIKGHRFEPADLRMTAGDKVKFINLDSAPHTATADTGAFKTKRLGKGEEAVVEITDPGTFEYFCEVHPGMRGRITAS